MIPGDQILSRVANEFGRRRLCVTNAVKIKSVKIERRGGQAKKDLGQGLQYQQTPEETPLVLSETPEVYMAQLAMYLLALTVWGTKPRSPVPAPPEGFNTTEIDHSTKTLGQSVAEVYAE